MLLKSAQSSSTLDNGLAGNTETQPAKRPNGPDCLASGGDQQGTNALQAAALSILNLKLSAVDHANETKTKNVQTEAPVRWLNQGQASVASESGTSNQTQAAPLLPPTSWVQVCPAPPDLVEPTGASRSNSEAPARAVPVSGMSNLESTARSSQPEPLALRSASSRTANRNLMVDSIARSKSGNDTSEHSLSVDTASRSSSGTSNLELTVRSLQPEPATLGSASLQTDDRTSMVDSIARLQSGSDTPAYSDQVEPGSRGGSGSSYAETTVRSAQPEAATYLRSASPGTTNPSPNARLQSWDNTFVLDAAEAHSVVLPTADSAENNQSDDGLRSADSNNPVAPTGMQSLDGGPSNVETSATRALRFLISDAGLTSEAYAQAIKATEANPTGELIKPEFLLVPRPDLNSSAQAHSWASSAEAIVDGSSAIVTGAKRSTLDARNLSADNFTSIATMKPSSTVTGGRGAGSHSPQQENLPQQAALGGNSQSTSVTAATPLRTAEPQMMIAPPVSNAVPARSVGTAPGSTHLVDTPEMRDSIPSEKSDILVAMPSINAAKMIQTMSESEMRVGMYSNEFGTISIRTSVSQQQMFAQISLDHSDLSHVLTSQLSALQAKIGDEHGLRASIEVNNHGTSSDSGFGQASQNGRNSGSNSSRNSKSDVVIQSDPATDSSKQNPVGSNHDLDVVA